MLESTNFFGDIDHTWMGKPKNWHIMNYFTINLVKS